MRMRIRSVKKSPRHSNFLNRYRRLPTFSGADACLMVLPNYWISQRLRDAIFEVRSIRYANDCEHVFKKSWTSNILRQIIRRTFWIFNDALLRHRFHYAKSRHVKQGIGLCETKGNLCPNPRRIWWVILTFAGGSEEKLWRTSICFDVENCKRFFTPKAQETRKEGESVLQSDSGACLRRYLSNLFSWRVRLRFRALPPQSRLTVPVSIGNFLWPDGPSLTALQFRHTPYDTVFIWTENELSAFDNRKIWLVIIDYECIDSSEIQALTKELRVRRFVERIIISALLLGNRGWCLKLLRICENSGFWLFDFQLETKTF
jgi:hypothetical protein